MKTKIQKQTDKEKPVQKKKSYMGRLRTFPVQSPRVPRFGV
jgi:hypothetical protein